MSRPRKRKEGTPTKVAAPDSKYTHLVLTRESDQYDLLLMEGMKQQTLAKCLHLPGARELMQVSIVDLFEDPHRFGGWSHRLGDSRMVFIERGDVLYLFSMGSAAKDDLKDTNAFVAELVALIDRYQFRELWASAITRMLRSPNYIGDLMRAMSQCVEVLHCEAEIAFSKPEGKLVFQILAMVAALERDYIVARHTAGRVAQWRRGEWIPIGYPPGYRIHNRKLVLAPDGIHAVRRMLLILADTSLTPAAAAQQIGALGIATPKIRQTHGETATIADARNPSEVVHTLTGWVDLYEHGAYTTKWSNPFPGVDHVAGLKIEAHEGYPNGMLPLRVDVEVPEGGWADETTFAAIRTRLNSTATTGGAAHRVVPPLAGMFQFVEGDHEYALIARSKDYYRLYRRLTTERQFHGWYHGGPEAELIATIDRSELHRNMANQIIEAVASGLPAELDAHRFLAVGSTPPTDPKRARLHALRRQLGEAADNIARARRNLVIAADTDAASVLVDDLNRQLAAERRVKAEIDEIEATLAEPEIGAEFDSNAGLVAHALAALANVERNAELSLNAALRTVISVERCRADDHTFTWELNLELPHPHGTIVLGPITGDVRNRRVLPPGTNPTLRTKAERRAMADQLITLGLRRSAAQALAACPHSEIANLLHGHLRGTSAPNEADPAWAQHIISTYTNPTFQWSPGQWRIDDADQQHCLSTLARNNGRLDRAALLSAGISSHHLHYFSRPDRGGLPGGPIIELERKGRNPIYRLRTCPHCGCLLAQAMRTPETREGLLCTGCSRTPSADSPVFPTYYTVFSGTDDD